MSTYQTSTLSYALLGLVSQHPRSGYQLRKIFAATPLASYSDSPGAIYPALKKLERAGLIAGTAVRGKTKRPSREYAPTPAGRTTLLQWLKQPINHDDLMWDRPALMLKFAFMGGRIPLARIVDFLKQMEKALGRQEAALGAFQLPAAGKDRLTGNLAMRYGVLEYRAQREWVREAVRVLEKSRTDKEK